jgi:surface antigen
MRSLKTLQIAAVFLLCMGAAAHAQINPFRSYRGPTLSQADLDEGTKAAARLLGDNPKPVGTVETWTGPKSGNRGTLTVERAYQRDGQPCRAIRSRVTYKSGTQRTFLLDTCRVAGQWKLM